MVEMGFHHSHTRDNVTSRQMKPPNMEVFGIGRGPIGVENPQTNQNQKDNNDKRGAPQEKRRIKVNDQGCAQ